MTQDTAIFAAGCFWCVEAVFDMLQGVELVEPGYIGGHVPNPTYKRICDGDTGHAEAIRVAFDPSQVRYEELLELFFHVHDPTQLNRQGNDVGTQYRSAIFPQTPEQEAATRTAVTQAQADWPRPIVTTIEDGNQPFTVAEEYHHDYFERVGTSNPYCAAVVAPKVRKFREKYASRLKR